MGFFPSIHSSMYLPKKKKKKRDLNTYQHPALPHVEAPAVGRTKNPLRILPHPPPLLEIASGQAFSRSFPSLPKLETERNIYKKYMYVYISILYTKTSSFVFYVSLLAFRRGKDGGINRKKEGVWEEEEEGEGWRVYLLRLCGPTAGDRVCFGRM